MQKNIVQLAYPEIVLLAQKLQFRNILFPLKNLRFCFQYPLINYPDMNKDGHLTIAELSTIIYGLELLPPAVEVVPQNEGSFVTQKPT